MVEGVVTNVVERLAGSELAADASAGATTITVVDPDEFEEDGGALEIGSESFYYSSCDPDTGVTPLKIALAGSYPEGEPVIVSPHHIERFAYLREHGSEEELEVRVTHGLFERLPVGTRDPSTGELVEASPVSGGEGLVVGDVIGREPDLDSEYFNTERGSETSIMGLDPLPAGYTALDGDVTVSPDRTCLCLVSFGVSITLYNVGAFTVDGQAFASLLLDGVPIGLERLCGVSAKADPSGPNPQFTFPLAGEVIVPMEGGLDYNLAIGVKGGMSSGNSKVPGAKHSGITWAFYGG